MDLTQDSFSALARSSPWRWRALHFRHRSSRGEVEAWVRRPGWLLVRDADGVDHVETGVPYTTSRVLGGDADMPPPEPKAPQDVAPELRRDGLVKQRPDDLAIQYDDPMYGSFSWVAMLDPVELSHHVQATSLRIDTKDGRTVWRARLAAEEGYDPRCSCCPLLWSRWSDEAEHQAGGPAVRPSHEYPPAYEVALDFQTGAVCEVSPVGPAAEQWWFEMEILAVDDDVVPPV